jgi:ornithine cyclodeaminase/alanine dehydrogenase
MKWVSSYPGNDRLGLPAVMGLMVVNDADSGAPVAIMDCRWITAFRTGAVSAVAAKHLARPDARVLGLVGAGVQGRANLLALKEVLPGIRAAKVFDIHPAASQAYLQTMQERVPFVLEVVPSAEQAIRGAEVIVTATNRLEEPVFREAWVEPGALVLPIHHRGWENQCLHRVDKFVTDDWAQLQEAHRTVGGFYGPLPELHAELGEIVIGKKPGREQPDERILDVNYGLAIEDVVVATEILARARTKGLGTRLTLMRGDLGFV